MNLKPYTGLIVSALVLIGALGVYAVWYGMVSKKAAEASELGTELRTLGEVGGRSAMVRRAFEELEADEATVYGHLVDESTIVSFLETVETTGDTLGARIDVVSVGDAQGRPQQGQLQMALRITGTFDAVMRTLGAIEYQSFDTTLSSVTLDTADGAWTAAATFQVGMRPTQGTTTPKTP